MAQEINFENFYVQEDGQVSRTNQDSILCDVTVNGEKRVMELEKEVLEASGITVPDEIIVPSPIAVDSSSMSSMVDDDSARSNCPRPIEWGVTDTKFLLDRYEEYVSKIGLMNKFKNKKAMWLQISKEIKEVLALNRTSAQCETRFKTVKKRKKDVSNNKITGVTQVVESEEELTKTTGKGDSKQTLNNSPSKMAKKIMHRNAVAEAMLKIHHMREQGRQKREESRQKRHEERMEMLERLLKQ